jgi:quercetin dioxygenase-like cupin family protein
VLSDLEKFPAHSEESKPRQTFADVVVNKPWGFEFLSCETDLVACWSLFIKFNHQTSMHAHPGKQTVMVPLTDGVVLTTLDGQHKLRPGDVTYLDPGVFHRSTSTSLEGDFMLEFETPVDKFDLIRLDDSYGRVRDSYEGLEHESQLGNDIEFQQWLQTRNFHSAAFDFQIGGQQIFFLSKYNVDKLNINQWVSQLNLIIALGTEEGLSKEIRFLSPREFQDEFVDDIVAIGIKFN